MPSRMVINRESKRVTPNVKLGVYSDVNADGTVSVGIKHNLGESKVKLRMLSNMSSEKLLRRLKVLLREESC